MRLVWRVEQLWRHSRENPAPVVGRVVRIGRMIVACLVWLGIGNRCLKLDDGGLVAPWKSLPPHYYAMLVLCLDRFCVPSLHICAVSSATFPLSTHSGCVLTNCYPPNSSHYRASDPLASSPGVYSSPMAAKVAEGRGER